MELPKDDKKVHVELALEALGFKLKRTKGGQYRTEHIESGKIYGAIYLDFDSPLHNLIQAVVLNISAFHRDHERGFVIDEIKYALNDMK